MFFLALIMLTTFSVEAQDWANYGRYAEANKTVKEAPEAVLIGDSIFEGWAAQRPEYFAANNFVGRGIGGQVSAQLLARFRADVLDLAPRQVVILVGTNDLAQNQGPVEIPHIAQNICSMAELAKAHGIEVFVCSVLPVAEYPWNLEIKDVPAKVRELNALLREWASANGCTYVDFWTPMADERGGLPETLAWDGVHPTPEGFAIMEKIVDKR